MGATSLEAAVSSAAAGDFVSKADWKNVIEELIRILAEYLGQQTEVDPDPVCNEHGFSLWLFADEAIDAGQKTVWSGILSGRFIGGGGLSVSFVQFVFDARRKLRVRAEGDYVAYEICVVGDRPEWERIGWVVDDYGEWDDVPFPNEDGSQEGGGHRTTD